MYRKVSTELNFAQREKEVLAFWKEKGIVEKNAHLRDGAGESFTFFDGPPTANGRPHIGHVETRAIKDLIPRYQTMKGKSVLRKAGWDTHGLPVELEVEKKLGLDGKPQIEQYGIEPFIQECKKSVWKYLHEWEDMSERVGYWMDMKNPYVTYHDDYIESEWWSLKEIWKKGLLYEGHKVVPYCPRCGTALSSHEVAQGYKAVKEYSAFVRFKVLGEENTYIVAWTTTPWTLPSNMALCVNEKYDYAYFTFHGDTMIMARDLIESVFTDEKDRAEITVTKVVKGSELRGMRYEPLYPYIDVDREKAWYVITDDYVTLTDGTGVVHQAPAFGEDDNRICRKNGIPLVLLVDAQGCFMAPTPWEGRFVKDCDDDIMKELRSRGLLLKKMLFEHEYPYCWRCHTPLLYYARPTWFIQMTKVRDNLVQNNRSVNWYPDNIKEGRMGNFVENVVDWGLSRERYWGTPLPVWRCEKGHIHVIGSRQELKEMAVGEYDLPELHRPYIDSVVIRCPECGGDMHRVKEVIDCWYDSGAMPFAQWHYPFENKEKFEKRFPADFISEAIDQTRGWFYTLLAESTLLFGKSPFESCVVMGHVQDKDGHKMSKHLGNVVDPWEVLDKHGADAVRWYFYSASAPWLPSRFYDEAVSEAAGKFMGTLWNTYAFFILYADIDGFDPKAHPLANASLTLMDRWILSRLHSTIRTVDESLTAYAIPEAAKALTSFVDDLSNWYVRRGRERFWGKGMAGDKEAAFATLYNVLETLCGLIAPFVPFMAESIYQNLVRSVQPDKPESVHLTDFPAWDESLIDPEMERQMEALIEAVQLGRACRNLANLKVRQPLRAMYLKGASFGEEYAALAEDELNVKKVEFVRDASALTDYKLKPQMKTLGPKFGKLLGKIREALLHQNGSEVVAAFERGENLVLDLDGTRVELERGDVLTEPIQKEGLATQSAGEMTVALDTTLTDDLVREGFAREVVSKLQTMRKETGLDVTDRIAVTYACSDNLAEALDAFSGMISSSVLAVRFDRLDACEGREWDINGEKAVFAIEKAE